MRIFFPKKKFHLPQGVVNIIICYMMMGGDFDPTLHFFNRKKLRKKSTLLYLDEQIKILP